MGVLRIRVENVLQVRIEHLLTNRDLFFQSMKNGLSYQFALGNSNLVVSF